MEAATAQAIWNGIGGYFAIGAVVAFILHMGGLKRVDPLAWAAPFQVKALITPGLVALWPVMALKLARGRTQ